MKAITSVAILALFSLGVVTTAAAQQPSIEATSQPAVAALRAIARTIRECPETVQLESRWGKGPLEIDRFYFGPPKNVVWDVAPSKSVRAPYAGFIEFSVSYYFWVPPETRDKYDRKYPGLLRDLRTPDFKRRYEYDVGPEGLELIRALSRREGQASVGNGDHISTEWADSPKVEVQGNSGVCWDNAARKSQTVSDKGKQ
jgi:hypothetical protein